MATSSPLQKNKTLAEELDSNIQRPYYEGGTSSLAQKLWSDEEQVAILEGAFYFWKKTGVNAGKDVSAFHEFMKSFMHVDFTVEQLKDKILEDKFRAKNGINVERAYTEDHKRRLLKLHKESRKSGYLKKDTTKKSRKSVFVNEDTTKKSRKSGIVNEDTTNMSDSNVSIDNFSAMEQWVINKGIECSSAEKKKKIKKNLKNLHIKELELYLKKNDFMRECAASLLSKF